MPPPESKRPLSDRQRQILKAWIAQGATYAQHWAFTAPKRPAVPARSVRSRLAPAIPIDAFVRQRLAKEGLQAGAGGRQANADPPGDARSDRPAADAGRGRCLPRRHLARRLREGGGPAACVAAVRRADGDGLAGRRPVRRHQRVQQRRGPDPVAVARLADPVVRRQPAVRPVPGRAARRRPAAEPDARPEGGDGVPPQPGAQHGGRHHPGGVPGRVRGRPGAHDGDCVPRPVDAVRPLPRPQVRPDHAARSITSSSASSRTSPTSRPATRTSSAPSRSSASRRASNGPGCGTWTPGGPTWRSGSRTARPAPMPPSPRGRRG